jgi:8-oxo-dGTP diphosphatase
VSTTEPNDDPTPRIAAAVIAHQGKVLLVKRRISEGALSWQFPAGAIEPGETPSQAAVRETKEETGLTVTATKTLGERVHPNTGRTMIYVACDVLSDDPAAIGDEDELSEFTWASRDALAKYVSYGFYPAVQDYLDEVLAKRSM